MSNFHKSGHSQFFRNKKDKKYINPGYRDAIKATVKGPIDKRVVKKIIEEYKGAREFDVAVDLVNAYWGSYNKSVKSPLIRAGIYGLGTALAVSVALAGVNAIDDRSMPDLGDLAEYNHVTNVSYEKLTNDTQVVNITHNQTLSMEQALVLQNQVDLDHDLEIVSAVTGSGTTLVNGTTGTIGNTTTHTDFSATSYIDALTQAYNNLTTDVNVTSWLNQSLSENATYLNQALFNLSQDFSSQTDLSNVALQFTNAYVNSTILNNPSEYNLATSTLLSMIVDGDISDGNVLINNTGNSSLEFQLNGLTGGLIDNTTFVGSVANGTGSGYVNITNATGNINTVFQNTEISGEVVMNATEFAEFWTNVTTNGNFSGNGTIYFGNGNVSQDLSGNFTLDMIPDNSTEIKLVFDNAVISGGMSGQVQNFNATGDMTINNFDAEVYGGIQGTGFNGTFNGTATSSAIDLWMQGNVSGQSLTLDNNFKNFMIELMDSYMKMGLAGEGYLQGLGTTSFSLTDSSSVSQNLTVESLINASTQHYNELKQDLNSTLELILNGSAQANTVADARVNYALDLAINAWANVTVNLNGSVNGSAHADATSITNGTTNDTVNVIWTERVEIPISYTEIAFKDVNERHQTGLLGLLTGLGVGVGYYFAKRNQVKGVKASEVDMALRENSETRLRQTISTRASSKQSKLLEDRFKRLEKKFDEYMEEEDDYADDGPEDPTDP